MNEDETTTEKNTVTFTDVLFAVLGIIALFLLSMMYPI